METIGLRVKTLEKKKFIFVRQVAQLQHGTSRSRITSTSTLNITGCCLRWWIMSKYENLLLAQLKTELRKRKARLSRRKQELTQR